MCSGKKIKPKCKLSSPAYLKDKCFKEQTSFLSNSAHSSTSKFSSEKNSE